MSQVIVGVDIGTTKISTIIAKLNKENKFEILGKGIARTKGMKKGNIEECDLFTSSIKESLRNAEKEANTRIDSIFVNISPIYVELFENEVKIDFDLEKKIDSDDLSKLHKKAQEFDLPNEVIIDIIPHEYNVDSFTRLKEPRGVSGKSFSMKYDLAIAKKDKINLLNKCIEKAGARVKGFVIEAFTLKDIDLILNEECDNGVLIIDIGGEITNISVFKKMKLVDFQSIPVGGENITTDIEQCLKIPRQQAEILKLFNSSNITGNAKIDPKHLITPENELIDLKLLDEIIVARVEDIFKVCKQVLMQKGMTENFVNKIVLTGRGLVAGSWQHATNVFGIKARNIPISKDDLNQEFYICAGIIRNIHNRYNVVEFSNKKEVTEVPVNSLGFFRRFFKSIVDMVN